MIPETNLATLLKTMNPRLHPGRFVFTSVTDLSLIDQSKIIMSMQEEEGMTIIIKKEIADAKGLNYSFVAAWITLTVYSDLKAVGLTAAFSSALAGAGISCNVVAGLYHDHIFVESGEGAKAMEVLKELSGNH